MGLAHKQETRQFQHGNPFIFNYLFSVLCFLQDLYFKEIFQHLAIKMPAIFFFTYDFPRIKQKSLD